MDLYARCVVANDPRRAAEIVETDYRTQEYQTALRSFAMQERDCVPRGGKLKFQPIVFAGYMAEDLLRMRHIDVATLKMPAVPPRRGEWAACVVVGQPGQVGDLLRTAPASLAEEHALQRLSPTIIGCLPADRAPVTSHVMLRAILALVSYRQLEMP